MKIVLVYPHKNSARTPDAIGFNLAKELTKRGHDVVSLDLREYSEMNLPSDSANWILLGHPTWRIEDTFYQLWKNKRWKQVSILCPFCPGDPRTYAYLGILGNYVDTFGAIMGEVWKDKCDQTIFSELEDSFTQIDLAVDSAQFPPLSPDNLEKKDPKKWLFVGNHPHFKNVEYLNKLAVNLPDFEFHRIGPIKRRFKALIQHGQIELLSKEYMEVAEFCRFFVTPGTIDANPTTILEAMGVGLVPVAPVGSGYYETSGILPISGVSLTKDIELIYQYSEMSDCEIQLRLEENKLRLLERFNWIRFTDDVLASIEKPILRRKAASRVFWRFFLRNKISPIKFEKFLQSCAVKV